MVRRLLLVVVALLIPLGTGAYILTTSGSASAGAPTFNNGTDTVNCSTFDGSVLVTPALALGGSSPTTIAVKGVLLGCSDTSGKVSGSDTSNTAFSAKVSGTLSGATNNITTLAGSSTATGTLTVSWKGFYYDASANPPSEKLLYKTTTVSLHQIYGTSFCTWEPIWHR